MKTFWEAHIYSQHSEYVSNNKVTVIKTLMESRKWQINMLLWLLLPLNLGISSQGKEPFSQLPLQILLRQHVRLSLGIQPTRIKLPQEKTLEAHTLPRQTSQSLPFSKGHVQISPNNLLFPNLCALPYISVCE